MRNFGRFVSVFMLILIVGLIFASQSKASPELFWQNYTIEDGLPSNDIEAIGKDAEGNLWVGSHLAGAGYFDGEDWSVFRAEDGLADNTVQSITANRDSLWFGHLGSGLSHYDGGSWRQYGISEGLTHYSVNAVAFTSDSTMWVGHGTSGTMGSGGGLTHFDGNTWNQYTAIANFESNTVSDLVVDSEDNVWVAVSAYATQTGLLDGGIALHNGINWVDYTSDNGLPNNDVRAIAVDSNNHIWAGTTAGLAHFDGTNWVTYTIYDGLVGNYVQDVAVDAQGTVWIATNQGVSKRVGDKFENITTAEGLLSNNVQTIFVDDDIVWFGTNAGLSGLFVEPMEHQIFMPILMQNP